ncbi:hypothetical protein CEV34_1534 [Brucella pseudogrignonensis]|uniref:Uncharacterized protein n=1 Tax=Brucella pseudogrignonensis TaxID=419475 RepID=A0A256GL80_9HYPH|nr:hypothetical protein CEV34_1534 [Brucella pseudogrignonensis]
MREELQFFVVSANSMLRRHNRPQCKLRGSQTALFSNQPPLPFQLISQSDR